MTRGQLRDTTFASTTVPLNHLTQPEVAQCASPLQFGAQPDRDWRLVSPPSHGMPMNQGYYGAAQGMTANGPTCRGISSELEPTVTDFGRMGEGRGDDEKQMRHGTAMPCGWEMRIEPNGRALYINHNARVGLGNVAAWKIRFSSCLPRRFRARFGRGLSFSVVE